MTLRELFSRSAELLWQNPRLLLPVLLADVVKYLLLFFGRPVRLAILTALLPRSVFGGYAGSERAPLSVFLAGAMMEWITNFLCISSYVVALGILANWVPRMQKRDANSIRWVWPRGMRPVSFLILCCMILFAALAGITSWLASGIFGVSKYAFFAAFALAALIVCVVFSWFVYRFVRANGNVDALEASRWQSSLLFLVGIALGVVMGGEVLHESVRDEGLNFLLHQRIGWLMGLFLSLLSAIPFAWSFVGMSLRNDHTEMATSSVGENECFE